MVESPKINTFCDSRLTWINGEPGDGNDGKWWLETGITGKNELVVRPAPNLDYWSRTFYNPLLIKHNGQSLCANLPAEVEATITTSFTLYPRAQFDQAGVMILVDKDTWVKAGIEFFDGVP